MKTKQKYALTSLLAFILSLTLFIYGVFALGLLNKDQIVVTTLATTGPDFEVVFGQMKLKIQMPDTVQYSDVSGIMVTGQPNKI